MSDELFEMPVAARHSRLRWTALAALVGLLAAGVIAFAQARDEPAAPNVDAFAPTSAGDPADLVGAWWPESSASLDGWMVAFSPTREFAVFGDSCAVDGMWRASLSGLITIHPYGAGGDCDGVLAASNAWFSGVVWFTADGGRVKFLDGSGEVVMTLSPATDRSTWPGATNDAAYLLENLGEEYSAADPVNAPPDGIVVPMLGDLVDVRWKPLDVQLGEDDPFAGSAEKAFARFSADGRWGGSDGCNGQGGTWALNPDTGEWLATSGVSTLMGCANVPVSEIVTGSTAVGLDGDELVFYGADGTETGRFVAESPS